MGVISTQGFPLHLLVGLPLTDVPDDDLRSELERVERVAADVVVPPCLDLADVGRGLIHGTVNLGRGDKRVVVGYEKLNPGPLQLHDLEVPVSRLKEQVNDLLFGYV